LTNDIDADGDAITALLRAKPAHGNVILKRRRFFHISATNYNGLGQFHLPGHGRKRNSGVATVTITITRSNDAPVRATTPTHGPRSF